MYLYSSIGLLFMMLPYLVVIKLLSQRKEKYSKLIYFCFIEFPFLKNSILSEQLQNIIEIAETGKFDTTHIHVNMTGQFPGMIHVL